MEPADGSRGRPIVRSASEVTVHDIARATGGATIGVDAAIRLVVADGRDAVPGSAFVALRGTRTDGHAHVEQAFARGAVAAVVDSPVVSSTAAPLIRVRDTRAALMDIASLWRSRLRAEIVGVTGSVGKTTTKDLLATILARRSVVTSSPRSFNNRIGVPLTILSADEDTEILVCELGAGAVGDIARLAAIARPQIGIVTVVAPAHLEGFGSLDGVAEGKSELVRALPREGTAILNADDARVASFGRRTRARVTTYGRTAGADVRATEVSLDPSGAAAFTLVARGERRRIRTSLIGRHLVTPMLAAAAGALELGASLDDVARGLSSARASPGRMEPRETPGGVRVLDDSYNANPRSMAAAIDALAASAGPRRIAVLGEMSELGDEAFRWHERIGDRVARARIELLVTVGDAAGAIAAGARAAGMAADRLVTSPDAAAARRVIERTAERGDVVLVKASRSAGLDRLVTALVLGEPNGPDGGPVGVRAGAADGAR